jgi:hypothetical protein
MRYPFVFIAATLLWCPVFGKGQRPEERTAGEDTVWTTVPKGSKAAVECLRTVAKLLDSSGADSTNYDSVYALARQRWIQFSLGDGISERPRQTVWRPRDEVPPLSVDKASLILALDMLGLGVLDAPRLTPTVAYAARGSRGIVFAELADGYVWLERIKPGQRKSRLTFSGGTSFRHPNRERIRRLSDDATVRDWFVVFPSGGAMCSILARYTRPGGVVVAGLQWYPGILRRHFERTRGEAEAEDWPLLLRDNPCEAGGEPR